MFNVLFIYLCARLWLTGAVKGIKNYSYYNGKDVVYHPRAEDGDPVVRAHVDVDKKSGKSFPVVAVFGPNGQYIGNLANDFASIVRPYVLSSEVYFKCNWDWDLFSVHSDWPVQIDVFGPVELGAALTSDSRYVCMHFCFV